MKLAQKWLNGLLLVFISSSVAAGGKILATPGVAQVEGAGGGGLVPWAQLAGYATEDQFSASAFITRAEVENYSLKVKGIQFNLPDRIELSYARQSFEVPTLSTTLEQDIFSAKVRLYGDIVYSKWPQVSLGLQNKKLKTPDIANLLGATETRGNDYYLAVSKLHLGGLAGYNLFWNISVRRTSANELGLLGFGGPSESNRYQAEFSSAAFLRKDLAIGFEYRQKPDNLSLGETDWQDIFIAWFPNKHLNLTLARLDLGTIAGMQGQRGWYLSLMANL